MSQTGARLVVRGVVQGVGYRYFCFRAARDLGLVGWTMNMPDGSVAVEAEGDRGSVEALIQELKVGPSHASVTDVNVHWQECSGLFTSFDIRG